MLKEELSNSFTAEFEDDASEDDDVEGGDEIDSEGDDENIAGDAEEI